MTKKYYLKHNIQAEPLVNLWYAWTYLISPSTASMIVANSQNRIMDSYIALPEVHEDAVKRPEMLGGPFMDFETRQVEAVKLLQRETNLKCKKLLDLAEAIKYFSVSLGQEADGHSLEPIYSKIPQPLKGLIELFYDLNHNPNFRFIEALLYESEYNLNECQTILLTPIEQDYRPFSLSTPRLPQKHQVHLTLPFASPVYDQLFEMKNYCSTAEDINGFINLLPNSESINRNLFFSFFSETKPIKKVSNINDGDVRIRYFGHACILIDSTDCSILIDPVISYDYKNDIERYTYNDLPDKIDYLVITHAHLDHVLIEHLIQLRHKVKKIIVPKSGIGFLQDPSLKLFFQHIGFKDVIEIDDLETIDIEGGSITGIPFLGEHADLNIQTKKGHLIKLNNKSILCAADSNNIEPEMYKRVQKIIGDINVIFIGMECDGAPLSWVYGALFTTKLPRSIDQSRRLNGSDFNKALNLVQCFNCQHAYVYAMGQEPWLNYVMSVKYSPESKPIVESNKFVEACLSKGIISERLFGKKEIIL